MIESVLTFWIWLDSLPLKEVVGFFVAFAALITALGVIYLKLLKPVAGHARAVGNLVKGISEVVEAHRGVNLPQLVSDVKSIRYELHPNGGSSLRDAVDRTEIRVVSMERVYWATNRDATVGIFRCTVDGHNLEVNRTYCRWLECSTEELLGLNWRMFLTGASARDDYDEEWRPAFEEGREVEFRLDFKTSRGVVRHFNIHCYPLHDRDGTATEYLGVVTPLEMAPIHSDEVLQLH